MLVPDFDISPQINCSTLYLQDTTCDHSTSCLGGYGGTNIAKSQIKRAKVTLVFGQSGVYEVAYPFDPSDPFVITGDDISQVVQSDSCGCKNDVVTHGAMLPSGCVTITYEPQYQDQEDKWVSAGKRTKRFILKCIEVKRAAQIAKRILERKMDCQYDFRHTSQDLLEAMAEIYYIQSDLDMLVGEKLSCECVTRDLQQINARLNQLEKSW